MIGACPSRPSSAGLSGLSVPPQRRHVTPVANAISLAIAALE
jgi:hypothetical protein